MPEVIDHGRTRLIVDDWRQTAAALEAADALDPAEMRREVEERFTPERMVADYVAAYGPRSPAEVTYRGVERQHGRAQPVCLELLELGVSTRDERPEVDRSQTRLDGGQLLQGTPERELPANPDDGALQLQPAGSAASSPRLPVQLQAADLLHCPRGRGFGRAAGTSSRAITSRSAC